MAFIISVTHEAMGKKLEKIQYYCHVKGGIVVQMTTDKKRASIFTEKDDAEFTAKECFADGTWKIIEEKVWRASQWK